MHEIRAVVPASCVDEVVKIANAVGIAEVTTNDVLIRGPEEKRVLCSVETSTPKARAFVEALKSAPVFKSERISLTSREVRAIVNESPIDRLTLPMGEPFPDVVQDLWQLSHVTLSYIGRALAGAVLMATGIIEDNPIAIVVAALFLPFLSQVLAMGVGCWHRDKPLAFQGMKAVGVSIVAAFLGGVAVAAVEGGPINFHRFHGPLSSLAISAMIGTTAGLSSADDTGRRYLIGVAAAVQLAIFPVWMGTVAVLGVPDRAMFFEHLLSFVINLGTIAVVSVVAYAVAHARADRAKT